MTDLLVIGGGAAGLMAAGAACARGLTVTVLEHNPKGPGQKLLITGKGRCNVTSDSDVREFLPYVRHNGRFLYYKSSHPARRTSHIIILFSRFV